MDLQPLFLTARHLSLPVLIAITICSADAQTTAPAVTPAERIELFDGKTLSGWKVVSRDADIDPAKVWSAQDGVLRCTGQPNGYARTEKAYQNYKLHVEWRWPNEPGNSGVFLHVNEPDKIWPLCLEAQLRADDAGTIRANGGSTFRELSPENPRTSPLRTPGTEKPIGEWNSYDLICRGDTVTVFVNGTLQNEITGSSVASGAIALQSEGRPVEFRNVIIEPIGPDAAAP
jgi:hypothetical protein